MKFTKMIRKEFDAKKLSCQIGVRYWEDASVNGVEDTEGSLIPCRIGDTWCPVIDVDNGIILNWEGVSAEIHYKVCDAGLYTLIDANEEAITVLVGYVPDMMCPEGDGYGDYIIMNVDTKGVISKWTPKLKEFIDN